VLLLGLLVLSIVPPLVGLEKLTTDQQWYGIRTFAVLIFAAFPAFLFARFVKYRSNALWTEFALNLHRLAMDRPRHLPQPPVNSDFTAEWVADGGLPYTNLKSVYEGKFEAIYGTGSSQLAKARMLGFSEVLPVYLFTLVLAVCWTVILWGAAPFDPIPARLGTVAAVAFGFLGAYAFSVQALIRRYFQSDLRPAAFTGLISRFLFVFVAVYTIHEALGGTPSAPVEAAFAFLVGFFPSTAVQILRIIAAKLLRGAGIPNMNSDYPLNELDGMTIWIEARLLEIGVEDMQNLATANLTDVLLQSRVPVARLVDWIDQSILYLHLPSMKAQQTGKRKIAPLGEQQPLPETRHLLRTYGIRAATDLRDAVAPTDQPELDGASRCRARAADVDALGEEFARAAGLAAGHGPSALRALYATLASEPNLYHVQAWKAGEKPKAPTSGALTAPLAVAASSDNS
jgi:hypothetical protein